jgi:choice-of-anchor B domain-containing protein
MNSPFEKALACTVVFPLFTAVGLAQQSYDVNVMGRIWFSGLAFGADTTGGSDCWGYTASDGTEYALMGVVEGIAVVNAATMEVITVVPGPTIGDYPFKHRDIKTYRHYAYAVAEMTGTNDGLMIMDMQYLPDSVRYVGSFRSATDIRSHNFSIDTTTGYAYILKSNYSGFRIVSLADPENPVEIRTVTTPDIHDVFARNDTVWVAEGTNGSFSMYDVTDKNSPVLILRHDIPAGGYVHNIWPTSEGRYAATTEETDFKTVKIWDVSDPGNVTLVSEYLAPCNLAHNVHVKGNLLFISHYESGVRVVDITDPSMPEEVGFFDTFQRGESPNFRGCWGTYPFTANGLFYASDIEGYLTVLRLDSVAVVVSECLCFVPNDFHLLQNYPNPFNPQTTIEYHIPEGSHVRIRVFDILGQPIATLVDERKRSGVHVVTWTATTHSSGVYICQMEAGSSFVSRSMVLTK